MGDVTDPAFSREERLSPDKLRVTRKSTFTGAVHTLDLSISELEWAGHQSGRHLVQEALPSLTNPEREFLLTGATQDEWLAAFPPDEEDDPCGTGDHCCWCGPGEVCCDCGQIISGEVC